MKLSEYDPKTTPVDADLLPLTDSGDSNETKNVTIADLRTAMQKRVPDPAPVPSDTTIDLTGTEGNEITITGTDQIENIVLEEGRQVYLLFEDELTLLYDPTDLPILGKESVDTKAEDKVLVVGGAGDVGYIEDIKRAERADAAADLAVPVMRVLQADFSKTNDTFANITDWSVDVVAGHWYRVILDCLIQSDDAGLSKLDFAGGSCTTTGAGGYALTSDFATNAVSSAPTGSTLAGGASGGQTPGEASSITAVFIMQINAGGTFIPRFAQITTDASPSTLKKYSTLQVIDVTP